MRLALLALLALAAVGLAVARPWPRPAGLVVATVVVGAGPRAIAVDGATGRAFVVGDAGVDTLDAATGARLGTTPVRGVGDLAVAERAGRVYVALRRYAPSPIRGVEGNCRGGEGLEVLDARDGSLIGPTRDRGATGPVAVDERAGRVAVWDGDDNNVSLLDAATGRLVGRIPVDLATSPCLLATDARTGRVFALGGTRSPEGGSGGPGAQTPSGGGVSVIDDGAARDVGDVSMDYPGAMAVDGAAGRVYVSVAPADSTASSPPPPDVLVLDARSGQRIGAFSTGLVGWVDALAVDERAGRLFALSCPPTGACQAATVDARDGRVLGTTAMGSMGSAVLEPVVDAARGRVYVANTDAGTLSVLDAGTGRLLRTLSLGGAPRALAVAGRAGRVLVALTGGTKPAPDPLGWLPARARRLPFLPPPGPCPRPLSPRVVVLDDARL